MKLWDSIAKDLGKDREDVKRIFYRSMYDYNKSEEEKEIIEAVLEHDLLALKQNTQKEATNGSI